MPTQLDVAREALAQVGTRSKIVSLTDGSAEAQYVNLLYAPIRDFLLREGDYDFSMFISTLELALPPTPPHVYNYVYPIDALRIRQLFSTTMDVFDPRPIEWSVEGTQGIRTILTRVAVDRVIYTKAVSEELWDSMFEQSFVRMLASALAFALENRIEASKQKMEEAMSFAGIANLRDS